MFVEFPQEDIQIRAPTTEVEVCGVMKFHEASPEFHKQSSKECCLFAKHDKFLLQEIEFASCRNFAEQPTAQRKAGLFKCLQW